MRLLTVDPGMRSGFGLFVTGEPPRAESYQIPGSPERLGEAVAGFDQVLSTLIGRWKPEVIGYATLFIARYDTCETVGPIFAFIGKAEELAFRRRLRCICCDEREARDAFGGIPRKNTTKIKNAVKIGCRTRGWHVPDDHAGDSLVIGDFLMSVLEPSNAHTRTPLFTAATMPAFLKRPANKGKRRANQSK